MSTPANIFDKTLVVTEIRLVQELTSGELMHQVSFGEYVSSKGSLPGLNLQFNPQNSGGSIMVAGNKVPAMWLALNIKAADAFPYAIGSKWKMTIKENGTVNLVEV